jgi:hypothetical protein
MSAYSILEVILARVAVLVLSVSMSSTSLSPAQWNVPMIETPVLQPVVKEADNLKFSVMAWLLIRFISHPDTEALRLALKSAFDNNMYGYRLLGWRCMDAL